MRILRKPFTIIRDNLRPYLIINAVMYGIFLLGFGAGLLFPELTAGRVTAIEDDGTAELVKSLLSSPWMFALTIFGVNLSRIALLTILLPSLVVPFAGFIAFAVWAFTTGVTLVPTEETGWVALIPHSLTVVIEFQAYILLLLGAYLIGKYWLRPRAIGAPNRRWGYLRGLQSFGWLGIPALVLFVIGAIYEAFSLIYWVPPLTQQLLG